MTFDLEKVQARISLVVRNYFISIRKDMNALFGEGNHGLAVAVLMRAHLGEGQVFTVPGSPERVVLRKRFGGHAYDTELHADHFGCDEAVRAAPEDELFADLVTLDLDRVADVVFAQVEAACVASGPDGWGKVAPQIAELRAKVHSRHRRKGAGS